MTSYTFQSHIYNQFDADILDTRASFLTLDIPSILHSISELHFLLMPH